MLDAGNSGKVYGAWLHDGDVYLTTGTPLTGSGAAWYNTNNGAWKAIKQRTGVAWFVLHPTVRRRSSCVAAGQRLPRRAGRQPHLPVDRGGPTAPARSARRWSDRTTSRARRSRGSRPGRRHAVQITGQGVGPNDGFTATGEGDYDPRWGDYGAATVTPDGTMWFASEYIAQRCTVAEFNVDTTCGYTRTFYANWSTHITGITPLP